MAPGKVHVHDVGAFVLLSRKSIHPEPHNDVLDVVIQATGAADGASLPISVEVDEELNVGEEEDVVLTVGGDEDDRLTVGRELDVGIEEEADPLPDTVGMLENNDGTKEDCPPPEVNEVGATEGDDIASAVAFVVEGEGEYVTDPPEDEKLGDGEEEIVVPLEIPRVELNAVGGIVGT